MKISFKVRTAVPEIRTLFARKANARPSPVDRELYDTGFGGAVPRDESYVIVNYTASTLDLKASAFEGLFASSCKPQHRQSFFSFFFSCPVSLL